MHLFQFSSYSQWFKWFALTGEGAQARPRKKLVLVHFGASKIAIFNFAFVLIMTVFWPGWPQIVAVGGSQSRLSWAPLATHQFNHCLLLNTDKNNWFMADEVMPFCCSCRILASDWVGAHFDKCVIACWLKDLHCGHRLMCTVHTACSSVEYDHT